MEKNNRHPLSLFGLDDNTDLQILDTYRYINGRRFHNVQGVDYFLPNDEEEASRLDLHHRLIRYAWQGNFTAPMHERFLGGNSRVLDVGCGTGSFIMDLTEEYPKNSYVGIDISEIFPGENGRPPNATFIKANLFDGLPFENDSFDFVCQRCLGVALTEAQWKEKVVPELVRVLKPGGWIEFMEFDLTWFSLGPKTNMIANIIKDKLQKRGTSMIMCPKILELLKENNIQNTQIVSKSIPIGSWGGQLGELLYKSQIQEAEFALEHWMKSVAMTFEDYKKISAREADEHKTYSMSHRVFGVKPQN